jgi:ResB-like family protein
MSTVPIQGITALKQAYLSAGRGLWQWCSSRGALSVLLLLLASALALSYAFPQTPAYVRSDPNTYEEWLSATQVQFKSWTPFLEAIGVFGIHDALWFRVLLAILMFVLLVSLADRASMLVGSGVIRRDPAFYTTPETTMLSSDVSLREASDRVRQAMKRLGLKQQRQTEQGTIYLLGYRTRWAKADTLLVYLGAAFAAAALAVNGTWGWQQSGVHLLPGESVLIGPSRSHEVVLADVPAFSDQAAIRVNQGQQFLIARDHSTFYRGYGYQLAGQSNPWVQVSARRSDGEPLVLSDYVARPESRDTLQFAFAAGGSQQETDRLFIVPDEKLVVRLKWLDKACATADQCPYPHFRQWVFEQGGHALVGEAQIETDTDTATTQVADVVYDWHISRYVIVDVTHQPGRWILGMGICLAALGVLGQMIPRQQVWSEISQHGDKVVIRIRSHSAGLTGRWKQQQNETLAALRAEIGSS